jgi:hypothetical protein
MIRDVEQNQTDQVNGRTKMTQWLEKQKNMIEINFKLPVTTINANV